MNNISGYLFIYLTIEVDFSYCYMFAKVDRVGPTSNKLDTLFVLKYKKSRF
jgi:hypothetical protein